MDMSKYYVINYDTSKEDGSHWVAITDNILYDSLSMNELMVNNIFEKYKLKYINKNIIQNINDNTCGQHSLTFLLLYSKYNNGLLNYL
jgi:hypothetical protein